MKLKRFIRNIGYSFSDMLDEVGTFIHVQWDRYCLPFIHNRKNMFIALVISVIAIILFLFISIIFHLNPHNINWAISFVWFINIWSGYLSLHEYKDRKYAEFDRSYLRISLLLVSLMFVGSIVLALFPKTHIYIFVSWFLLLMINSFVWHERFKTMIPCSKYSIYSEYCELMIAIKKQEDENEKLKAELKKKQGKVRKGVKK